jgi:hypothetical protein
MTTERLPSKVFLLGIEQAGDQQANLRLEMAELEISGQQVVPVFTTTKKAEYFASHAEGEFGIDLSAFKVYEVFSDQINKPVVLDPSSSSIERGRLQTIR